MMNNIKREWGQIRLAAGLQDVTIHDLRRSSITNWARVLPIHVVQELAGHANIETTRRYYLAVTQNDMAAARKATEDVLKRV